MADNKMKPITTRSTTPAIPHSKEKESNTSCHCFVGFCVLALLASSITLVIYYLQCAHGVKLLNAKWKKLTTHRYVMNDTLVSMQLIQNLDAEKIRGNLRYVHNGHIVINISYYIMLFVTLDHKG